MSTAQTCSKCGATLPPDAPGGVCPRCVLELGWTPGSEPNAASRLEPGPTTARESRFAPPAPQELARHFPQLEMLELLGQGGMGAVYKARQRALDRLVAVKVLPAEVGRDPAFAQRFTREAQALARLSHPNIVAIHDVGESGGFYYFIMEYVDGANLRELLAEETLSPAQALAIVPQVCEALQFAHDEGIVHRDIKPENILVDKKGRVKIADFGLAKLLGAVPAGPQLTGTYQVMGTYHYMAPEQFERPQEVDHRADIYSLGVVLYELLTHELPIGRFALPSERAKVDVRLDEVVLRALQKDPPRRYQHASEVKTDVDAIARGAPAIPPVVQPAHSPVSAAPPGPPRAISVPVKIDNLWGGFAEGHGVLRFDGEELLLEFDVRENVFQVLRLGSHRAPLPLYDLSAVAFKPGWWAHTIVLQVSRFHAIAHLPGTDRGQMKLTISGTDRELGARLCAAVTARLAGDSWSTALAKAEAAPAQLVATGNEAAHSPEAGRAPGGLEPLIVGSMMLIAAIILIVLALNSKHYHRDGTFHAFFWPGIGLLIGGGGCLAGGIKAARRSTAFRPGKTGEQDVRRAQALEWVRWPGLGLLFASGFDTLALLGLFAAIVYAGWTYGPPEKMGIAYTVAALALRLACAPLQLAAAIRMRRLENRRLAMLGAAIALLPGSPAWLLGLPMGVWALLAMRRSDVVEAFESRSLRPWGRVIWASPILAACGVALMLVTWTWMTLPREPVASGGEGKWITQQNGPPRLTQQFTTRVELRPGQEQAINDILEASHQKYRSYFGSNTYVNQFELLGPLPASNPPRKVGAIIRPFPIQLCVLESRTWKQIDLVLDERQRGLAHQCDLLSDLFFVGRGQVRVELQSTPELTKDGNSVGRTHYTWKISRRGWLSGMATAGGGDNLPRNLQPVWDRANTTPHFH
jgi:predicted Ser/Thr protein kinase